MKLVLAIVAGITLGQAQGAYSTSSPPPASPLPLRLQTRSTLNTRLANVHVDYDTPVEGSITFTYGLCDAGIEQDAHHVVARNSHGLPHRLIWVIPKDAQSGGCVSAWSESGDLVGRSGPQRFHPSGLQRDVRKRDRPESIPMNEDAGIDVWGPWFDGVASLEGKNLSAVDVDVAKSKDIAIVGAGMSGLMTYLILHQAGVKNVTILEASKRLGGRIRTQYMTGGPFNYSYQEMGAMRIPESTLFSGERYTIHDHQLVFQLAEEMNRINNHDKVLNIDFVPFIQSSPNGLMYYNEQKLESGLPPTRDQVAANASLVPSTPLPPSAQALSDLVDSNLPGEDFLIEMTKNVFKAHSEFLRTY